MRPSLFFVPGAGIAYDDDTLLLRDVDAVPAFAPLKWWRIRRQVTPTYFLAWHVTIGTNERVNVGLDVSGLLTPLAKTIDAATLRPFNHYLGGESPLVRGDLRAVQVKCDHGRRRQAGGFYIDMRLNTAEMLSVKCPVFCAE